MRLRAAWPDFGGTGFLVGFTLLATILAACGLTGLVP
jgi:hypothetical protein